MKDKIIKKLLLQKKYWRYKYLFPIKIWEINILWVENFINIYDHLKKIKEKRENIKYFRLESNYKEYFEDNKEKVLIEIEDEKNIETIEKLFPFINNLQFIYKINTNIDDNFYNKINKLQPIYYIENEYKKSDLFWINKNIELFNDREVLLSLNKIKNQDKVYNEIIFEIISLLKDKNAHVNLDFLRLESAYKKLYVLWPKELHLDLSEYCNTNCNFCVTNWPDFLNRDINKNNYKITFSWEQYINLFKGVELCHTESIALWITWEPFLHPDIKYILNELRNINIKQWFLTNWYKLLENIENIILNKNIKHLYINISSWNLKSFNQTRKWDNFKNFLITWEAIKILSNKRNDIIIRWLYVITPQNICWIEDFVNLAIKNNLSEIELKRVVPYEFSEDSLFFSNQEITNVINIFKKLEKKFNKENIKINNNFEYIINEFEKIIWWIQAPESDKIDKTFLKWITNNCYNPYFYLSILRNDTYSCWKFIWKIWKLNSFHLKNILFKNNEAKNIISWAENLKQFLWERKWKEKCSRCHHMDVNNMVDKYIKIKNISNKINND